VSTDQNTGRVAVNHRRLVGHRRGINNAGVMLTAPFGSD
jgi:hypothetical protein